MDRKLLLRAVTLAALVPLAYSPPDALAAAIYRWVDDNGNPVLSDRPPEARIPYTEIGGSPPLRRYPKQSENAPQTPDNVDPPRTVSAQPGSLAEASASSAVTIKPEPELCQQALDNIFKLETFPRSRVQDPSGEVRFMSDAERAEQLRVAKEVRDANCR